MTAGDPPADDQPVEIPLTGELDLHAFAPRDIASVVEEYVLACAAKKLMVLRLVHGRGTGAQRAVVRRVLGKMPQVASFADAPALSGGWGATVVHLRAPENDVA